MVHRIWWLNEIVRAIAANLVTDSAEASAVALARCSKSLEEPALAEVWRSLDSLAPLVQCFPPEIWRIKTEKLYFKRAPIQAEWTRFKWYASKLRHLRVTLDVTLGEPISLSLDALHLLQQHSPGIPLFPNLLSLDWFTTGIYFPFTSLFISPSLTSIFLRCVPQEADTMLPLIFNKLSALPRLRVLVFHRWSDLLPNPSIEEALSHLLMQCNQHLRTCNVDWPISAAALEHTIQLPSLEVFCLIVPSFQLPNPLPTVVFPSLRKLDLEYDGDPAWLKLLSVIEHPALTSIKIRCPGSAIERFMKTFQLVTTGCGIHQSFRELWMDCPDQVNVTSQMIACNFPFKNLTSLTLFSELDCFEEAFDLQVCKTVDVTDNDIDLLTNAMPHLEELNIGGCEPCHVPSQITFKSLYTISHRCTRLTTLMIHFNPTSFVTEVGTGASWDEALGLSNHKTLPSDLCSVTQLWAGDIPLPPHSNASYVMAMGLVGVFPCLETIEYENGDWKKVLDLLGVCRRTMSCIPG